MNDRNWPTCERAEFAWTVASQRHHSGYSWLKIRPSDMAKLGQLCLDQGRWHGRQVAPASWVRAAPTSHITADSFRGQGYGYQWWVITAAGDAAYLAVGSGGRIVEVVPRRGPRQRAPTRIAARAPGRHRRGSLRRRGRCWSA